MVVHHVSIEMRQERTDSLVIFNLWLEAMKIIVVGSADNCALGLGKVFGFTLV